MKASIAFAFLAAGSIFYGVPASASVLQPIQPWVVHYDPDQCYAERMYGAANDPDVLAIRMSPTGDTFELLTARKGRGPRYPEEFEGTVDFGAGPIRAWLLRFGSRDHKLIVNKFRIAAAQMAQAAAAPSVNFHIKSRGDQSFALGGVPNLLARLDKCNADLQRYWNMPPANASAIAAPAEGEVRSIFTSGDYPNDALTNHQEGRAQFLLFIDEQGNVAACHVSTPSGIPALDAMGCQAIRDRAKFRPAVDQSGKAIRSSYLTPPIKWELGY